MLYVQIIVILAAYVIYMEGNLSTYIINLDNNILLFAKLKVVKELCWLTTYTKPLDKYNAYDVRRKILLVYVQLYPIGYVLYTVCSARKY